MSLDHALTVLDVAKPFAKLIPVVGEPLEGVVELLTIGCKAVQDVQTNKEDSKALSEHAALLIAVVVRELMKLGEDMLKHRIVDINELLLIAQDIKDSHQRRNDKGYLRRMFNKEKDKEEIKKLSLRLDRAAQRFELSTSIVTRESFALIIANLEEMGNRLREGHTRILEAQHAMNSTIISMGERDLLATLRPVHSARHDVEHAPTGCLENTRVDTIRQFEQWALNDTTKSIYWLSGLGGIGKTAIARTICDRFTELRVLGAAFFISWTSAERRDPQNVLRSIIHQLAHSQPLLRAPICEALQQYPMLVEQSMLHQIQHLLLTPLRRVREQLTQPVVIVIDALDECEKDKDGCQGGQLLPLLLQAIDGLSPFVKLVVTSRLDRPLQSMFAKVRPEELRLHRIEETVVRADIRIFLEHNFRMIAEAHSLASWPPQEVIEDLAKRADKLFIFATTIINYVRHPQYTPAARLASFLARKPRGSERSEYDDLDALYLQVLQSALGKDPRDHDDIARRRRTLLGVLIVLQEPLPFVTLKELLELEEEILRLDLEALSAVIVVPERGSDDDIVLFHASFEEFIKDPARCTDSRFLIKLVNEFHSLVALRCCKVLTSDNKPPAVDVNNNSRALSPLLGYAWKYCSYHTRWAFLPVVKEVVKLWRGALRQRELGHPDHERYISEMSYALLAQCEREDSSSILGESISIERQILELRPLGHPQRNTSLDNLAVSLTLKYEKTGEMDLLEEVTCLGREALELRPLGHPERDWSLANLAVPPRLKYGKTGEMELLEEATRLEREALELRPLGHPQRDWSLGKLATSLRLKYEMTGEIELLEEATCLDREALELRPLGHPQHDWSLSNLASSLTFKYAMTGETDLLEEATCLNREALELRPLGHPQRDAALANLANSLRLKYEETGEMELLGEATCLSREALELCPLGHPRRNMFLTNLANSLTSKYKKTGEMDLLEEATRVNREALELCPLGHPHRDASLNHLAILLRLQHDRTGESNLLEEAISLEHEALEPGHT